MVADIKNKEYLVTHGLDSVAGPTDPNAKQISIPNECVNIIMGNGGDTLKEIQYNAGAEKVELSANITPGTNSRNIYVIGSQEAYLNVKKMVEKIIENHMKTKLAVVGNNNFTNTKMLSEIQIPTFFLPKVVGQNGENLRNIESNLGCTLMMSQHQNYDSDKRILQCRGTYDQLSQTKNEIDQIMRNCKEAQPGEIYDGIECIIINSIPITFESQINTIKEVEKERNPITSDVIIREQKPAIPQDSDPGFKNQISQLFG